MNAFYADPRPTPCLSIEGARKALFIGIGGGGDVASATVLAKSFARCGGEAIVGSFAWERFSVDPVPGPIRLGELEPLEPVSSHLAWAYPSTVAKRMGRVVKPQVARAAQVVGRVLVVDVWASPRDLARELKEFVDSNGIDIVVGVDVGGDSLATGCEESLWSPLADAVGVAMLSLLSNSILAIVSPGADGELDPWYVESRISTIARLGGFLGGYVFSSRDAELFREVTSVVHTEASTIPLRALEGFCGELAIRGGSRRVRIGIANCVAYFLNPSIASEVTLAKFVKNCSGLEEANEVLHELGVYTELDLERDLFDEASRGREIDCETVLRIRDLGRKRLGPCRASELLSSCT